MRLILDEQQKQEEKRFFDAVGYDECIVEYEDYEGDIEKILIVKDDNYDYVITFWRLSVYVYSTSSDFSLKGVYEQIEEDFNVKKVIDIYQVSASTTFERIEK